MDSEEFVEVVGKLTRFDSSGRDLLDDIVSTGGFRRDDGTLSALAYDLRIVNRSEGTAEQIGAVLPELPSDVQWGKLAAAAILTAGVVGVIVFKKPFAAWFQDTTLSSLAKTRPNNQLLARFLPREERSGNAVFALPAVVEDAPEDLATAIELAVGDTRNPMTAAEAKRRLARMLAAALVLARESRALSTARLADEALPELQRAIEQLSTQQVADMVNKLLEQGALDLDEASERVLRDVLGGGRVEDGEYVPIMNTRIHDALHLDLELPARDSDDDEPDAPALAPA